jgi:hypothetical protein
MCASALGARCSGPTLPLVVCSLHCGLSAPPVFIFGSGLRPEAVKHGRYGNDRYTRKMSAGIWKEVRALCVRAVRMRLGVAGGALSQNLK